LTFPAQRGSVLVFGRHHIRTQGLTSRAPQTEGTSSVVIYLDVEDVDTVIDRAVAAGAEILIAATDAFWGDRVGRIIDPSGHVWNIAAHIQK